MFFFENYFFTLCFLQSIDITAISNMSHYLSHNLLQIFTIHIFLFVSLLNCKKENEKAFAIAYLCFDKFILKIK
jgi:hypothetical protein